MHIVDEYRRRQRRNGYALLSVGKSNSKLKKSGESVRAAILHLSPADKVMRGICPGARAAGCAAGCLDSAGRGRFNNVQLARIAKTELLRDYRAEFLELLETDLRTLARRATLRGERSAVRLNGTSDYAWHSVAPALFDIATIYWDYTKVALRASERLPARYHITLSYSGHKPGFAQSMLSTAKRTGKNLAVVFGGELPQQWQGLPVIDGDKTDYRWTDPAGVIVGLRAKGSAKQDQTGFVQWT